MGRRRSVSEISTDGQQVWLAPCNYLRAALTGGALLAVKRKAAPTDRNGGGGGDGDGEFRRASGGRFCGIKVRLIAELVQSERH